MVSERDNVEGLDGLWWLPTDPDRRVPGRLDRSASPWQLDLNGAFYPPEAWWFSQSEIGRDEPIIHGSVGRRVMVTLIEAERISLSSGGHGPTEQWWVPSYVTDALLPEEDTLVEGFSVRFGNLLLWAIPAGMRDKFADEVVTVSFPTETLAKGRLERANVELVAWFGRQVEGNWRLKAEQLVAFDVQPDSPLVLGDIRSTFVEPLREFISFSTTQHTSIEHVAIRYVHEGTRHFAALHLPSPRRERGRLRRWPRLRGTGCTSPPAFRRSDRLTRSRTHPRCHPMRRPGRRWTGPRPGLAPS